MTPRLTFLLLLLLLAGCQSEQKSAQKEIAALEAQVAGSTDPAQLETLLARYDAYLSAYPDDAGNGAYLFRAAEINHQLGKHPNAIEKYKLGLRQYPSAPEAPAAAMAMARIYEKELNSPAAAQTIWQGIVSSYPDFAQIDEVKNKLGPDVPPIGARMDALLQKMASDTTGRIDPQAANDYLYSAEAFALLNPNSPEAVQFLYKGGEVARAVRAFPRALELYGWVSDHYPNDERAGKALFMQAFTYDEDMQDVEKAKAAYENFLRRYPNDDFADDAQLLLDNLGKTDEELLQQFQQQQQ